MTDLTEQLHNLIAENKRKIEQLELQNLYAHKLLGLTRDNTSLNADDFLSAFINHTENPSLNASFQTKPGLTEEAASGESVAEIILQILQAEPGKPLKSIQIFQRLQELRADTPRSTFDAVINRLEEEHDDVVRLKRGVYQFIRG